MITKITGKLLQVRQDAITLQVDAFEYEVLICEFARRQLQHKLGEDVQLHTIQYLDGNPAQGRLTPRLVGFLNEPEREFFALFCSVDGVGTKKALRAMVRPVAEVATLIEEQDPKGLSGLPGIGPATAERIIAKLRRKVPRFALLITEDVGGLEGDSIERDLVAEVFDILRSLGHGEADARKLIDAALATNKKFKEAEDLIGAVYAQSAK
jgi:Holliday junction DNA helicase RuvA